jgi:Arc/MetJ-type ribon-helix-helix transcriptional regulator
MDANEHTALVAAATQEYEQASHALKERIEQMRKKIARDETKLAALQEAFSSRLVQISRAFAGLDLSPNEAPAPSEEPPTSRRAATASGKRKKRGAYDAPLLALMQELRVAVYTAPELTDAWNLAHPGEELDRSTVRGILERHVGKELEVVEEGGRGSNNPRTYRPKILDLPVSTMSA